MTIRAGSGDSKKHLRIRINKSIRSLKDCGRKRRKEEDTSIKSRMDSLSNNIAIFRSGWLIVALFVTAILSGLAGYFVPKLFEGR
jgi:hypothetical protein